LAIDGDQIDCCLGKEEVFDIVLATLCEKMRIFDQILADLTQYCTIDSGRAFNK
jgi:hypothetical protein